jgi:hypothetical protein
MIREGNNNNFKIINSVFLIEQAEKIKHPYLRVQGIHLQFLSSELHTSLYGIYIITQ